jgi:putative hydrolase of the HAD superfamily
MNRLGRGHSVIPLQLAGVFFSEASLACNRGEIDAEQFLKTLQVSLGVDVSASELREAWCDIFSPWPEMESLAEEVINGGHEVYLLSNTDPIHFQFLSEKISIISRFTGLHLSYEVGLLKPDPAYFRLALQRFGLQPQNCIFIDDRPEHVDSARSLGINALVHRGEVAEVREFLRLSGIHF